MAQGRGGLGRGASEASSSWKEKETGEPAVGLGAREGSGRREVGRGARTRRREGDRSF